MRPVVLCFSGLDPSGGAGLQADIEAIAALGCHAAVVCTALTVQDSQQVYGFQTVDPALIRQQADKVLADLPVRAIKLGMLGCVETVHVIDELLAEYPDLPVVLDPVLAANSGGSLTVGEFEDAMRLLLPRATVITPNSPEARRLAEHEDLPTSLGILSRLGARAILLKGGHEAGDLIRNELVIAGEPCQASQWPRLPGEFHGSGCTLASAIAAGLAQGLSLPVAVTRAEVWLQATLARADHPHLGGQAIPRRIEAAFPC